MISPHSRKDGFSLAAALATVFFFVVILSAPARAWPAGPQAGQPEFQGKIGLSEFLIIHWPKGIKEKGGLCRQYGHAIDLMPTIPGRWASSPRPWSTASSRSPSKA